LGLGKVSKKKLMTRKERKEKRKKCKEAAKFLRVLERYGCYLVSSV